MNKNTWFDTWIKSIDIFLSRFNFFVCESARRRITKKNCLLNELKVNGWIQASFPKKKNNFPFSSKAIFCSFYLNEIGCPIFTNYFLIAIDLMWAIFIHINESYHLSNLWCSFFGITVIKIESKFEKLFNSIVHR